MTPTLSPTAPLTALDRCDRCGAQAYVRVTLAAGGDLLFCGHHFREHEARLRPLASRRPGRDRQAQRARADGAEPRSEPRPRPRPDGPHPPGWRAVALR